MTATIRRLLKKLVSTFFLLTIVRRFKSRSSLVKIKAAQTYILGVKKTRLFFLAALLVFISFVFLINGLSLIQTALFTYSSWSNQVKFIVALLIGGIEFLGAISILIYLFREETWVKFTGIQKLVNLVIDEKGKNDELSG